MEKKSIYKVRIYNADATAIHFVAKSKMDAMYKYAEWLKENGEEGWIDETSDFDIEFQDYAYE